MLESRTKRGDKMGFTEEETGFVFRFAKELIRKKKLTGINLYKETVEPEFEDVVLVSTKYAHGSMDFAIKMASKIKEEFDITHKIYRRYLIYTWPASYGLPFPEEEIILKDDDEKRIESLERLREVRMAWAEGKELSLILKAKKDDVSTVVKRVIELGSFYVIGKDGNVLFDEAQKPVENSGKLDSRANRTPMIIVKYDPDLESRLPAFKKIKKLALRKEKEEISTYVEKNYNFLPEEFLALFGKPKDRLANRLFVDFVNFELDPRLRTM